MIKLVTAIALVAATLGTGCKKKERTEHDPSLTAPKTTEMKPDEKKPEANALPVECTEYRATIEKIRRCETLPQATRDALMQAYEQASSGWASSTPEARESLASSCRSANDAIKQSAMACP